MKITAEATEIGRRPPPTPAADLPDSRRKPTRRKAKTSGGGVRLKRESAKRSVHPETPLLKWKFDDESSSVVERETSSGEVGRKSGGGVRQAVSARKLGAGIWWLHSPDFGADGCKKLGLQFEPSFKFSNASMEGATNFLKQPNGSTLIPTLEKQLKEARLRINELETERSSSKKKLEQFLQKVSEERVAWRRREHEKVRALIDDMKAELSREKKTRQRLETVHSELVNELADAKLSVKHCLQQYRKERKARELAEEVCDELAKETGEDKDELETLKIESQKLWEEVDEERKMLQMAEVWREERVQMKLVDAKVMLEEKYSQMNRIIADLEAFPKSRSTNADLNEMNKTEFLKEVAASVNIQDIKELKYEPPNPDKCFAFEGINFGEFDKGEVSPCTTSHNSRIHTATPEVKLLGRRRDVYMDQSGELVEDASVWEALSQSDGQGSSYSTNISREWERNGGGETPVTDSEISSKRPPQFKKASSISMLQRSNEGVNQKLSNGRLSTGDVMFQNYGLGKGSLSPRVLAGQSSSPDSGNPPITRGMNGCSERTCGSLKSSLMKSRLSEARTGSQKIQLRQVLKQKI
ncbi:hypothetical protein C2S52_005943 [Perilla frutescens var. hirtella]|nr:hypothetical protein C2S52_005943 [Perilla frutescens var. hirtella]